MNLANPGSAANVQREHLLSVSCPACGSTELKTFYSVRDVPVHSVLLMRTREQAREFPRGDLELAHCGTCGFIHNTEFRPGLQDYGREYEETQGFSGTFAAFHERLARDLVQRHGLYDKDIIEIGCGKGEFLGLLCELGGNRGTGFDPAYVPERNTSVARDRITVVREFYSEELAGGGADFVCCKMTLEHVDRPAELLRTLRRSLEGRWDATVFFQVPDVRRVLEDVAFWDVYYEHCSYFSPASLAGLFAAEGFEVLRTWTDYDDQYLMLEARPRTGAHSPGPVDDDVGPLLAGFSARASALRGAWAGFLRSEQEAGRTVALWGGGSKAVAFLTTLGVGSEVAYAVDINPYKSGTFLAGTGHEIVAPEGLRLQPPDTVILMNPVYRAEVQRELDRLGISAELVPVTADPAALLAS